MRSLNFFFSLYQFRKLPEIYKEIRYKGFDFTIFKNSSPEYILNDTKLFVVKDVPDYIEIFESELPTDFNKLIIKRYPGFLIDFGNSVSLNDYLKSRFGKNSIYKLKREQRKLEHCFDVKYRMYFGEIKFEEYTRIFDALYNLLEFRSEEKGIDNNVNFKERDLIQRITFPMIMEKKASLFVIFNGEKPIDICLNFHLENLIYQHIRTYDIAYSKFNTGYTDLIKQIEWCIENKILAIVFSKGDFYWKRRWCNVVYNYHHHIYYEKRSLINKIIAYRYKLLNYLYQFSKEVGIVKHFHQFRNNRIKLKSSQEEPKIEICNYNKGDEFANWILIDYDKSDVFVRRTINNFLYETNQQQSAIKVLKPSKDEEVFFVKGEVDSILFKMT